MYAVVEIAGRQFKVAKADKIFVPKLDSDVGSKVKFDKVLMIGDEKQTRLGTPYVTGATIEAKILSQVKDKKVLVLRKKRRKGFKVRRGHRQQYTKIEITKVT